MSKEKDDHVSEEKAMEVAEESREQWEGASFIKDLFMGRMQMSKIDPFPPSKGLDDRVYHNFYEKFKDFLINKVDSDKIDRERKIPPEVIDGLRELGAFALKIPRKYGGQGFTQSEYCEILKLVASKDSNLVALLSAHQSIGVPQPLLMFGSEELKEKYLPQISKGAISAFALTEPHVGSDPANLSTSVKDEGDHYLLNGEKLWCTNGTIADLVVVMARHEEDEQMSAFVVEMNWEGVKVEHRCHFMGLNAIENGYLSFTNVKVPKENLIWKKGGGLKLALVTLNTGRLSLPAAVGGGAKKVLEITRYWCRNRFQWGRAIYQHEAIAHMIADSATATFAMLSLSDMAMNLYDQKQDIRLEAAVAKLYNTEKGWEQIDNLLQMRGGRGYETADSLKARGEAGIPVERMLRDFRINRIFEGTSEIMRLFIAREAVDEHLQISGKMIDKKVSFADKLKAFPKIFFFYATWYPKLWLSYDGFPRFSSYGQLTPHVRFIFRSSKKLARQIFHGMLIFGPKLQSRQGFLFRLVDIGTELFAMATVISRAKQMMKEGENNKYVMNLAKIFCEDAERKVNSLFFELWHNSDKKKTQLAKDIEEDNYTWLEEGIVELSDEDKNHLRPQKLSKHQT